MQPGYLCELLPDSAPYQPETLQQVFDGEVCQCFLFVFPMQDRDFSILIDKKKWKK